MKNQYSQQRLLNNNIYFRKAKIWKKIILKNQWKTNEKAKQCNNILENAEKKITILLEKNGDFEEKPFDTNNE